MSARRIGLWLMTLAAGTGLGAAAISWSQPVGPGLTVPTTRTPDDLSRAFREVAGRALPAVVWIESHSAAHVGNADEGEGAGAEGDQDREVDPREELFRRFFGDEIPKNFRFHNGPEIPREGHGSGFVIDGSGVILTNAHVVSGADKVIVHLNDGSEVKAESWVADKRSDVAIIRIKTEQPLPVLPLGNSDLMEVGDWVLAAGNPFDVGVTVTAGIISATHRGPGINERESYLQTDAAINPGNSGGPLVNLNGEVVGINTAISTSSGGYDGVGFAIPVNMARWVAEQLMDKGEVQRAYLGVQLEELTNDLRGAFKVPLGQGALVARVMPNTPAQEAGIQEGDIVLQIGGQAVKDRAHLQGIVEALPVDKEYPLVVQREGEQVPLTVTLRAMPKDYTAALRQRKPNGATAPKEEKPAPEFDALGLQVQEIDANLRKQLEIAEDAVGVVVTAVKEKTPAAAAGLQSGDVIEKVGGTGISTPDEFHAAVKKQSLDRGMALLVTRGQQSSYVVLKSE